MQTERAVSRHASRPSTRELHQHVIERAILAMRQNIDQSFPLEIEVEREPVLPDGPEPNTSDLALRTQMGRHWMRLLKQAGLGVPDVKTATLAEFGFDDISPTTPTDPKERLESAHLQSDPIAWQALTAVKGRLPDGRKLIAAIGNAVYDATGVRLRRVPFRDERVLAALKTASL